MGLLMASYLGFYGILSGLTKSTDHPSVNIYIYIYMSEFTELAKSRFLDCDSYGMTQGAF